VLLHDRPRRAGQDDKREPAAGEVLLVADAPISRQHDLEASLFSSEQQVAVLQARPALIFGCPNRVAHEMRPNTPGYVLIEQD
jgi:hypothetical protein